MIAKFYRTDAFLVMENGRIEMGIKITSKELVTLLETAPSEQNIMLTGKHGIGKSQILKKYFEKKGQKVVTLFLGQMSDPGDLIGLPHLDEQTGKTDFMLPYWWPLDEKPIILFLDELNRARPEVLQTIMDLTLNRTLAGKELPKGSRIISAVNDGEEYQLTDLDPALVSRFNIYEFRPTVQEWLLWAQKNEIDSRVIDFISENPDMLDGAEFTREDQGLEKTPDRRGWEKVSDYLLANQKITPFHKKVIAGIVGMGAASKFIAFVSKHKILSAKEILLGDFSKTKAVLEKYTIPDLASINDSLFRFIETASYDDTDKKNVVSNLVKYFDFLKTKNLREAQAHFINLCSSAVYPNCIVFIVSECPGLYKEITDFIKLI